MRGVGNGEVSGEMAELRPGEIVAGHVIQRRIGTGGSGSVYVARHPRLPRMVALKIMHHDAVMTEAETWRRFQREADITARFDHPHIVSVYDRGVADDLFVVAAGGLGYGLFRYFASAPEVANAAKTQAFSTISTVAPTSTAGRPASDGQVPAAFLGHWSARTGPSGDGDYGLTITGGNIGDQVFSLTEKIALPGGGPATCTYTAVLESSNLATRISVAESRLDTTGSDRLCPVSAPRTDIEYRNGTLVRSGSNYAGATYTRATAQPIR
ncbi:protein kinase domain-containing protein [Nocardia tengchongensis]